MGGGKLCKLRQQAYLLWKHMGAQISQSELESPVGPFYDDFDSDESIRTDRYGVWNWSSHDSDEACSMAQS